MTSLKHYLGIARAPFLVLSVTLVASGAAASAYDGSFQWSRTLVALLGLVALHVAVNVLNEASDMRTGIDLETKRTPFSGGSGTLPAGHLSERTARIVGYGAFLIGAVCGAWFLREVGPSLIPIFVIGAVCVLAYTEFLTRIGVGEVAAGFGLGALPVLGTAMVQDGTLGPAAIAASIPAFFMTFNLLFLNEFPDEEADRRGGRRHLVILLGRRVAARVYAVAALATPLSILVGVAVKALPVTSVLGLLPSLLLVQPLGWVFGNPQDPVPLPAFGANVQWILGTNSALAVSFILALFL